MSDRISACCGRDQEQGVLTEIRYGAEAKIGWTMSFPDAALVDNIWTLENPSQKELLLLGSEPTQTTMVTFDLETQEISFTDSEGHPGFDLDNPTLAAGVLDRHTFIQITTGSMNVIPSGPKSHLSRPLSIKSAIQQSALFADDGLIATVTRDPSGSRIGLTAIVASKTGDVRLEPAASTTMEDGPSSMACLEVRGTRLIVVGTDTGKLLGYIVSPNRAMELAFQYEVKDLNRHLENSAITSLVALGHHADDPTLLLVGLRYGVLLCLEIKMYGEGGHRFGMSTYPLNSDSH